MVLSIVILLSFYIAINLLTLCKFPSIWRDDAYFSDPAWQFLKKGSFYSGLFESYENNIWYGRIHLISLSLIFNFFGCGPYQARIVSFISGLLASLFVYLIGKKMFDSKTGAIGATLFLLSKQFLVNSHWARQETMLTLFIVITIYIYLLAKARNSLPLFFLCGLIASVSADVHLNGVMLPIVVGVLFLFEYRQKFFKQICFWVYICGVMIGIFYWITLHILPEPSVFWHQWNGYLKKTFNPPIFSGKNLYELVIWEGKRYLNYIRYIWRGEKYLNILEVPLITIALIFNARQKSKNKRFLLIIIFTFMLLFTLLVAHKSSFYLVYLYSFFLLSVASFSWYSRNKFKIILGNIMIIILSFLYISQNSYRLIEFKENNYYKYLENLKSFISPECAVAGQPTWWFGFYNTSNKYYALAALPLPQFKKAFSSRIKEKK